MYLDKPMRDHVLMQAIAREAFYPGLDVDRSFLRKTGRTRQYTATYPVGAAGHIYELNDVTLNELAAAETPDTVKLVNLVKLMHDLVANERATKPFLMSIGEEAEALAEAFRDRQVSTEDALKQLTLLAEETLEAEKAHTATGLRPDAFATL